eukprot:CAMPEP_0114621144 /NCGR_PEP_ID=MMETSP0168-20121206/9082_1 /TAXON_ID=95228 ORGANISM="Vannella sp., Strain DIVA3 517/6/12" /NCGR_SAMPLE_ID=MMETSP0168 /ASSEMBLY_ACC=CAM_ASM_000044 /LENGTH=249 /DNA_ID=CAMNT_0001832343 /DNA_START=18 /DNA_END=765 /DNA_ORIENTATION=-
MQEHFNAIRRSVHVVNMDPAAEDPLRYQPSMDIRDLISLDEVMEELQFGPNGGLIYCMEFLGENMDWFQENIGGFEDDYLILDCPGQLELYTHVPVMRDLVKELQRMDYHVCAVYVLDASFATDTTKFISGALNCLSAMLQLEMPHINLLSKMDLLGKSDRKTLERILEMDMETIVDELDEEMTEHMHTLNRAIAGLIEQYSLVSFLTLNVEDEDSISIVQQQVDHALQYGEDEEPIEPNDHHEVDLGD